MRTLAVLFALGCQTSAPPAQAPAAPPAQTPAATAPGVDAVPPTTTPEGTAPLAVQVPSGLFRESEVRCANGSVLSATVQEAGANTVVMAEGLPLGVSCVIFWKGNIVSRLAPVTAGQRWSCKFRRAEPVCKRLGGPEGPTEPTPADWTWDKVDNKAISKAEAEAIEAGR